MTLRAVELRCILIQIHHWVLVERTECYFTLLFHSFVFVLKATLTKPVCVVLALSPPFPPEQEDHWKAILGKANSITVILHNLMYNFLLKNKGVLSFGHKYNIP